MQKTNPAKVGRPRSTKVKRTLIVQMDSKLFDKVTSASLLTGLPKTAITKLALASWLKKPVVQYEG